jgi:hypothetical protein
LTGAASKVSRPPMFRCVFAIIRRGQAAHL